MKPERTFRIGDLVMFELYEGYSPTVHQLVDTDKVYKIVGIHHDGNYNINVDGFNGLKWSGKWFKHAKNHNILQIINNL